MDTRTQAKLAKNASVELLRWSSEQKKQLLEAMADELEKASSAIGTENQADVVAAKASGLHPAFVERLTLCEKSVAAMAKSVREIAAQKDPVGEVIESWTRPNGMRIEKVRVPLGVIGIIYESRPNVTVDASALCLKAGNAVILRGGKDAFRSNTALVQAIQKAARANGLPEGAVQLLSTTERSQFTELTQLPEFVDLIIARGSEEMIKQVMLGATVPVLGHGKGVCHVYVDQAADLNMAEKIAFNAKVQRPGVCNAMETLLVHKDIAQHFLPVISASYQKAGVEMRGDDLSRKIVTQMNPATEDDWSTEYSALIVSIRVVNSVDEAIGHINRYGSGHSDSIVTQDSQAADVFLKGVDSAAVFHNASTRLHDGGVFGLGAEMGISTRKLHARGTMGARELTTTKYLVYGTGQIRE